MTDDELIRLLYTECDQVTREQADAIVARGAAIVPKLAAIVEDPDAWVAEGEAFWAPIHATFLLGAIGGEATVAPLVEALRAACDDDVDWVHDVVPSIFGRLGAPAVGPLTGLVRDAEEGDYTRMTACDALGTLARRHPAVREAAADALRAVAESREADRDVRWCAAFQLLCLARPGDRAFLEAIGREQDRGDAIGFFSFQDVEGAFAGTPPLTDQDDDWLDFYDPKEIEARQRRWEKGDDDEEPDEFGGDDEEGPDGEGDVDDGPSPPPIVNTGTRPGRNDPCPCGSGKKHKKCCGLK